MTQTLPDLGDHVGDEPPTNERLDTLEHNIESYKASRDTWTMFVLGLAFFIMFVSVIAVGWAMRGRRQRRRRRPGDHGRWDDHRRPQ